MQFEYTGPQTDFEKLIGGHSDINAFGKIEPGDDIKFSNFLSSLNIPPRSNVYIDSSGGDVEAAINIGRRIRDCWFSTSIGLYVIKPGSKDFIVSRERLPGQCMSAATLIFLGGRLRYFPREAKFGVHQFSFKNPNPEHIGQSQVLSAKIAKYIGDMGISTEFLQISSSVHGGEIELIAEAELRAMGVITGGVTDTNWTVQARNRTIYVRGERDTLYGHQKVMLGHARNIGFFFMAVIEAQGREYELTNFGLVDIPLNGEKETIDISDRCERSINGIYVTVSANLSHEEAKLIAYSDSFGARIRLSDKAPIFLGIDGISTDGGRDQLDTLFSAFSA